MKKQTLRKIRCRAKLVGIAVATVYTVSSIVCLAQNNNQVNVKTKYIVEEATEIDIEPYVPKTVRASIETASEAEPEKNDSLIKSMDWDSDDAYLLAKIAMAEAEGEDTEGKALVILVTLNRVWSDEFPGTIEEVILQKRQFSVTAEGGRWWTVEPDDDCWEALRLVENGWNESENALYFESKSSSKWHQENLELLFKHGNHYFYKEKEC